MTTTQRLQLRRGDLWDLVGSAVDGNSAIYDLTGASIWFTVKRLTSAADPASPSEDGFQLTVGSGITITDAPNGAFQIVAGSAVTSLLSGSYRYDIQIQKSGWAGPITITEGQLNVSDDVTLTTL